MAVAVGFLPAASASVQLKYLGTAGWEISDGTTVVLIDPYLSRLKRITPNDGILPGDTRKQFASDDIAVSDTATIDAHIPRADFVVMTHSHGDHALDLGYMNVFSRFLMR
jgi:L-ascorbate metabolism protein UlaG (beta-lactamase superfamily)